MNAFFAGIGEGEAAGIWQEMPTTHPEFRSSHKPKLAKQPRAEETV